MNIRKDLNYSRTIALNVLYIKEKEICSAYISEINSNCEKQIILLMILSELTLSSHEMLPKSVTSKHHGDFFCLNCLHSFATKNKLEPHE